MAENTQDAIDYEGMHWKTLESLLKDKGEEYTDVKSAIAFLRAQDEIDSGGDPGPEAEVIEPEAEEVINESGGDDIPALNMDEPYGEVEGSNAKYWQNKCHYDALKNYIKPEDVE